MSHITEKVKQYLRKSLLFALLRFIKYDILRAMRKSKFIPAILNNPLFFMIQKWFLRFSVRHIYGPKKIDYELNELIVVCLVRDGEPYIKSFMDYYSNLGVKHIVLLDNNSRDHTVSMARAYDNVTILQTKLPYKKYQFIMKEYLIKRFSRGRWYLCVDIDEFFDYPFSNTVDLKSLLEYLNKNLFTAVVGQMLDMFSDRPLLSQNGTAGGSIRELYRFYDISDVQKETYRSSFGDQNIISNEDIKLHWGGIRKTLFKSNDWLSKHPLVFLDGKTKTTGNVSHDIYNVHVADFTCVLFHYKFLDVFLERTRQAVQEENYAYNSKQYKRYYQVLQQQPNIQFKREHAKEIADVNELVDNQFLVVSNEYLDWVKSVESDSPPASLIETSLFLGRNGSNEA